MMLRGSCPKCREAIKLAWKDRPEDKGVKRSQFILCPLCGASMQVSNEVAA